MKEKSYWTISYMMTFLAAGVIFFASLLYLCVQYDEKTATERLAPPKHRPWPKYQYPYYTKGRR